MIEGVLFSEDTAPFGWSDVSVNKLNYGPKGAMLAALPRQWTPPFVLIAASVLAGTIRDPQNLLSLGGKFISRVRSLTTADRGVIVRSSVLDESIWDRGSYESVIVPSTAGDFQAELNRAAARILNSAPNKHVSLVVQRFVTPLARGEFDNLLRISRTRDHWELSTNGADGTTSRTRFNTQRDEAALSDRGLEVKSRPTRERLFGSIAAWLNNIFLRGRSQRLNCEWLTDGQQIYLVQIDEEDEDFLGVNPYQLRVSPAHRPGKAQGSFLAHAEGQALQVWDKLKVLDELWEPDALHKPTLFYVPLSELPYYEVSGCSKKLQDDFRSLIGPDNIVVRTSVRAGSEKLPNLPRTECVRPEDAAAWCIAKCTEFRDQGIALTDLAFVAHRFIASKASAWVRAEPGNALVEINSLWGLPDALQYCPYDIWEVHVPTEVATDYPDYKSNMLISSNDGGWEYVRIKNELARSLSIGGREALDLAIRTSSIAERIGRACHVMWFVGCLDDGGTRFSLPWYWIEAHDAEKNLDRSNYKIFAISDPPSLQAFERQTGSRLRQAIELKLTDINLMRDTKFIESVGSAAKAANVPVILSGSTLAHAYYQLSRKGCTVVTRGEKEHSRVRRNTNLGKLVRDKIPGRIAQRHEAEVTRKIPSELIKGFLTSKLLEEALEVRNAEGSEQKTIELADLYEVIRALVHAEGISLADVVAKADEKKTKAGGFEGGLVLLQTGILGRDRQSIQNADRPLTQILARKISGDSYEIPFSFFGFMELDQPRSLTFEDLSTRLTVTLKSDRIELRLSRGAEQLELPLDLTVAQYD